MIHWKDSASEISPEIDFWALYDLHDGPEEVNNVFASPEYSSVREKLMERLERMPCGG